MPIPLLDQLELPAWQSFNPLIEIGSGNAFITVGNGTLTGAYLRMGKMCWYYVELVFGTTTAGGSGWPGGGTLTGAIILQTPFQQKRASPHGMTRFDWGSTRWRHGFIYTYFLGGSPDLYRVLNHDEVGGHAQHNSPFTPTSAARFQWQGQFEIA